MNPKTQLEKLQAEIADINLKISEVEALKNQYAHEIEKLEVGDGGVTKVVASTVGFEATKQTIERYTRRKSDLESKVIEVQGEIKRIEVINDLNRLGKFCDSTYSEIVALKTKLSTSITESVQKVLKLQSELNQSQLEARFLLPALGFGREESKIELETFLASLGLENSAFRHQRLPHLHWQEVPQPVRFLNLVVGSSDTTNDKMRLTKQLTLGVFYEI